MYDLLSRNGIVTSMDRTMALATRRQALIASNLANIDTPGYKTRDIDFEQALKAELGGGQGQSMPMFRTHPGHLGGTPSGGSPLAPPASPTWERNDGNDVNLDRQTMLLARTQAAYQAAASFAQVEIRKVRQAISDSVAH
jgi:flagellar basal-body rod protein FlgB